jgi:hypothetical protein
LDFCCSFQLSDHFVNPLLGIPAGTSAHVTQNLPGTHVDTFMALPILGITNLVKVWTFFG